MPKTLTLIRASIADTWRLKSSLFPIIIIVILPVVILNLLTGNDQTLGSYGSFATLIMNVAAIYAVIKLKTGSKKVTIAQAYYTGTARFVAFTGVVGLLVIQMIPLIIGGLIYVSGSTGATVGLGPVELTLLGGIWLIFALPTLRWLTRSVFGLYLVYDTSLGPIASVKASSALVRGRSWSVFGKILAGTILMFIVLIIPSLAVSTLPDSASILAKVATSLLQLLSALILVPFATVYGYNILEALGGKSAAS